MDEDLVCSDFCEEQGYTRQAELLRALGGEGQTAYVVMERGAEYNDEIMSPDEAGEPGTAYLDREEAARAAAAKNAEWYRENNILDYCYSLRDVSEHSKEELERRIAEILGRPYQMPYEGEASFASMEEPLVDKPVTDEQMLRIADLFTLKFFYVAETRFAAPAPSLFDATETEKPKP